MLCYSPYLLRRLRKQGETDRDAVAFVVQLKVDVGVSSPVHGALAELIGEVGRRPGGVEP